MHQLSLLEYARLRDPTASDVEHVGRIAASVIAELCEEPPVDLDVVAAYRDINDIRVENLSVSGSLTPEAAGLVMRLRASDTEKRRRFTGFHEIGHTFQPGYREVQSLRCPDPSPRHRIADDPEALADAAAAELLLPRAFFVPDLTETPFGLDGVLALGARYEASIYATALRFCRYWPEPTLLLTLQLGKRKADRDNPAVAPVLRVQSVHPRGPWPHVPRNKSAQAGGPLHRALQGEIVNEMTTLSDLQINEGPFELSARNFQFRDQSGAIRDRVVALYRRTTLLRRHA